MTQKDHAVKGVALMLASGVVFCMMSGLIRYAEGIDAYKTTLFRFVIGLGLLGSAALFGRIKLRFVNAPLLFLRGLFGGIAVFIFFLSISKLGVGKGTVIVYAYPIFAAIFGAIFLRERIGPRKAFAIVAAFVGIYCLAGEGNGGIAKFLAFGKYELIAVLGAVLSGIAVVLVKRLHDTDDSYAIFFAQCAIGMWLVVIPANLVPCEIGYTGGALLLGIGILSAVGQLLMTEGYRHVSVTTGALLGLMIPVLNFIMGVAIFREPMSPRAVVGAVIVLASCAAVLIPLKRTRSSGNNTPASS